MNLLKTTFLMGVLNVLLTTIGGDLGGENSATLARTANH
jgi:hypothetical protein